MNYEMSQEVISLYGKRPMGVPAVSVTALKSKVFAAIVWNSSVSGVAGSYGRYPQ